MIHCVCESCNTAVEVSDNYAGTRIACKSCKAILRVPQADSTNGAAAAKTPAAATPSQPPAKAPAAAAPKPAAPQAPVKAPQPQVKAPAPAPQPGAKAPLPKPAAPSQPAAKAPAPAPQKPAAAPAPQAPAKPPQPQAKAPAPAVQPAAKVPPKAPEAPPEPTATLVMVEAVQFACTQCANVLQAWPEQVGMAMNCPYCQAALTVPTPAPPPLQARPAPVKSGGSQPNVPVKSSGSLPNVPVKSAGSLPNVPVKSAGSHPKAPQPPAKGAAPKKAGFRFPCEKCKAAIQADNSHIGLMMVCPQCKHDMIVPEPS